MPMKMQDIYDLIGRMENSSLTSLKLEHDGTLLELSRGCNGTIVSAAAAASPVFAEPQPQTVQTTPAPSQPSGTPVTAPLVGTFFAAASPNDAPFVQVGDVVKKGQPLCILEAMKTMNELPSPVDGTIVEILAQDGEAIGFQQVLFLIAE